MTRAGFVALIGEPNAGKSTLLNRMVGAKVSIVTHKVQTTRAIVRGIVMAGRSQVVFVDTPKLAWPWALLSLRAHLDKLVADGVVQVRDERYSAG